MPDKGYWTASSDAAGSIWAWYLRGRGYYQYCGYIDYEWVSGAGVGVRPVITVSNSVVFGS